MEKHFVVFISALTFFGLYSEVLSSEAVQTEYEVTVDIRHRYQHFLRFKRSTVLFPKELDATFQVQETNIRLRLKRAEHMRSNTPVYMQIDGRIQEVKVPKRQHHVFYQDVRHLASVSVRCLGFNKDNDTCRHQMSGQLLINGKQHTIKPASANLSSPLQRNQHRVKLIQTQVDFTSDYIYPGKIKLSPGYIVEHQSNVGDYEIWVYQHAEDLIRGQIHSRQKSQTKYHVWIQFENNEPNDPIKAYYCLCPAGKRTSDNFDFAKQRQMVENITNHVRRFRRQAIAYLVEILSVIDYPIFNYWFTASTETGDDNKSADAIEKIWLLQSHLFNEMDVRYQSITQHTSAFTITPVFAGLFIANAPSVSPWTEDNKVSASPRDQVDALVSLQAFNTWRGSATGLPEFDHAMAFTGYDLTYLGSTSNAGLAYVGGLCGENAVSISEDHFDPVFAIVASHELGHNLNSNHDADGNACPDSISNIMAPSSGPSTDSSTNTNHYLFSSCSVAYFSGFITQLDTDTNNCMTNLSSGYDQTALDQYTALPGEGFSLDDQCRAMMGSDESYLCRGLTADPSNVCQFIYCAIPNESSCRTKFAWEGTQCGNEKMCISGQCVTDSRAVPSVSDTCIFGDQPGIVANGLNCSELIPVASYACYPSYGFESRCCESCAAAYTCESGCEYGDKGSGCVVSSCPFYDAGSLLQCCGTCAPTPLQCPTTTSVSTTTTTPTITTTTPTTTTTTPTTTTTTLTTTTTTPTTTTTTPTTTTTTLTTTTTTPTTTTTTPTTTTTTPTTTTTTTTPTTTTTTPTTTTTTPTTTTTTPTTTTTTPTTTTTTPTTTTTTPTTTTTTPTTTTTTPTTTTTTPTTTTTTPTTTTTTPTTTTTTPTTTTTTPTTTTTTPTTTTTTPTTTTTTPTTTTTTPTTTTTTPTTTTTTPTTTTTTPTTTTTTPTTTTTTPTTTTTTPTTTTTTLTTTTTTPTTTTTTPTTTTTTPTTTTTTPTTTTTTPTTTTTTPTTTTTTPTTTTTTPTTTTTTPTTTTTTPTTTTTTPTTTTTTPTTTTTTPTTTAITSTTNSSDVSSSTQQGSSGADLGLAVMELTIYITVSAVGVVGTGVAGFVIYKCVRSSSKVAPKPR